MSNYTSLFEHWKQVLAKGYSVDEMLNKTIKDLKSFQKYINNVLFIQDYRDFGIRFVTDNVYEMLGYYPENVYSGGIDFGLSLVEPKDLSEVLVFQKKAFDFVQGIPEESRYSAEIRYYANLWNRVEKKFNYIQCIIRPLCFDNKGNVILDIANWQFAKPLQNEGKFVWNLSYRDKKDKLVEKYMVAQLSTYH